MGSTIVTEWRFFTRMGRRPVLLDRIVTVQKQSTLTVSLADSRQSVNGVGQNEYRGVSIAIYRQRGRVDLADQPHHGLRTDLRGRTAIGQDRRLPPNSAQRP